jgi:hypothetical protein
MREVGGTPRVTRTETPTQEPREPPRAPPYGCFLPATMDPDTSETLPRALGGGT